MSSHIINNTNINYNKNKICNQTATSLLELDSNIPYNIFIRNLKSLKAGQVVVNFDIILEKNRIIFHGSRDDSKIRTVRGKVRLEVAGKLNEIILSLVEKQGTVFSSSILLENKRVLLSGIHEFHFEFLLPGDLSESMNSDAVLCKYFLKAELMTRFPSELSTDNNKSVDIVDLFIERAFLESDDDITNGLRPTRFIVDKISFCFVQSECYNIANNGCIVHNEKSIAGPFCFQLPKNEPLRLQSRPTIFKLPICESFVNDYDLVNIKIRHQLDVKIQLNNFKKDQIEFSIPISVKSIIPNQDTLPLPHKIDLSNSVACLQLGNEIYTSLTKEELKVPLLSSYISEQTAYHHGEDNLHDTIIGLAQNFVGSNNINLLELIGQFGARKDGDKRNAAPGSHPLLG
ncbi:116_t:CDS:2 [Entrophospora sp. SA101]|nr:116_t:CDS:2 [Entrophospora sp. SA101]